MTSMTPADRRGPSGPSVFAQTAQAAQAAQAVTATPPRHGSRALAGIATAVALAVGALASVVALPAAAQEATQFIPVLSYRTGPYAPSGIPVANGTVDYYKLVNARGGINGVKIAWEECETGYDTARSVECYERLKGQGGGAALVHPWSTGATFAITAKAPVDKIPLVTTGYGLSESADGRVFKWNFPLAGTYWTAADVIIQAMGQKVGGLDKLKGKKIALVYHDSPFGKEPIPLMTERAKRLGFEFIQLPVTAPGVEQKATWLQIRQQRPDFVALWGWGVMNSTAIKEAQATGYARDKIYGVWWSSNEPDVRDLGDNAKGYNGVTLHHSADKNAAVIKEILEKLHGKGQGTGPREEVGDVLYLRGVLSAMVGIEGIRAAQEKFGKGKQLTGEQVRWGLENLQLTREKLDALGFAGVMQPILTSCDDHAGSWTARIHTWDGKKWGYSSDWINADKDLIWPLVKSQAERYAADKKITPRTDADCKS